MSATPFTQLPHIVASQAQKEVTANAAFDGLDRVANGRLLCDAALGDATAVDSTWGLIDVIGTAASAIVITVPARQKLFAVRVGAIGASVTVKTASGTGVSVSAGTGALLFCDGSDVSRVL